MKDNRPAFPNGEFQVGMSLRDYFAGQALAGIMANPIRWEQIAADYKSGKKSYEQCSKANAVKAYSIADAMIAVRQDAPETPLTKAEPGGTDRDGDV